MGTMTTTAEKIKQSILNIVDEMLEKSTLIAEKGRPLHKLEKDIFAEAIKGSVPNKFIYLILSIIFRLA